VLEELADACRHEDPARLDRRLRDLAEHGGRRALDHHLGVRAELRQRQHRHRPRQRHAGPRLVRITRAHRHQAQVRDALVQARGEHTADRAEAGEGDAKLGWPLCGRHHDPTDGCRMVEAVLLG
jgi:hypothetical protein